MVRWVRAAAAGACLALVGAQPYSQSAAFDRFVDSYLDEFAKHHPSIAAGNGLHDHDELLDDFTVTGIQSEIATLKRERTTLQDFAPASLTPDQAVDRRILLGLVDAWLLEQETLANWRKNPMLYASALTDGIHNLMTVESDPAPVRMRRIISKLRQIPTLLAAARGNVSNPPELFVERGASMMHATSDMLGKDLELAFAKDPNTALRDSLRRAAGAAIPQIEAYATYLERDILPKANGDFAIGGSNLSRRYLAEELIDTPLPTMVAIGERELARQQAEFKSVAQKIAPGLDAKGTWLAVRKNHPAMGGVVAATSKIVDSLTAFVISHNIATVPAGERVVVAPAPPFDLGFASMHASPPLEKTPVKSVFYITDANPSMTKDQQDAWLERYNYASLSNTAAHEAMPGHWLHSTYMRRTPGKVRRIWIGLNPFPQPSSGQDGWAHYAEQMVLDQGFANGDPKLRLAQISDALTRICRLLSGIKLHTKQWTLDDAQRCFENDAYVAAPAARREAERGAYDPTYGGYFLGKMGILKLRDDYQRKLGAKFNLREFHERFMTDGIAPIPAHRQLLLPGDTSAVLR